MFAPPSENKAARHDPDPREAPPLYQELREVWTDLTAPGAPFEVTEAEVRGQTIRVYAGAPNSLRDIWLRSVPHADKDYLVYTDERWTFAEAHQEVANIATWLVANGVSPGDHAFPFANDLRKRPLPANIHRPLAPLA